mmetsp:Transcript_8492/g.28141  ORF Transcript_8492/g.28141 Transcript_8492/m.28141 type:complete len:276 (-) Transcript_8492:505-1332(-)
MNSNVCAVYAMCLAAVAAMSWIARSTSSSDVCLPTLRRSVPSAFSVSVPIAASTPDTRGPPPLWHAAPALAATSSASSARRSAARNPIIAKELVLGSLCVAGPLMLQRSSPIAARSPTSRRSRSASMCAVSAAWSASTSAEADPIPTKCKTFSVPARLPDSWPPPQSIFGSSMPSRIYNAATPFGAPNLCPTTVHKSALSSRGFTGILPQLCAASVCTSTPAFAARAASATAATGWIAPVSLFACMTETRHVSGVTSAATASGSTMPSSLTGARS